MILTGLHSLQFKRMMTAVRRAKEKVMNQYALDVHMTSMFLLEQSPIDTGINNNYRKYSFSLAIVER